MLIQFNELMLPTIYTAKPNATLRVDYCRPSSVLINLPASTVWHRPVQCTQWVTFYDFSKLLLEDYWIGKRVYCLRRIGCSLFKYFRLNVGPWVDEVQGIELSVHAVHLARPISVTKLRQACCTLFVKKQCTTLLPATSPFSPTDSLVNLL